jgi:hypothetical protein
LPIFDLIFSSMNLVCRSGWWRSCRLLRSPNPLYLVGALNKALMGP